MERVDLKAIREESGDGGGRDRPMGKEEVVPALRHPPATGRQRPGPVGHTNQIFLHGLLLGVLH